VGLRVVELFGYAPDDAAPVARDSRKNFQCPFLRTQCAKVLRDGTVSGVCTVRQTNAPQPIICCPVRLYAGDYSVLSDVAREAFGSGVRLIPAQRTHAIEHDGLNVVVFGKRWGKELRLPNRGGGGYFVDWILAQIGADGKLNDFVAIEVQAIDTTGNYRGERDAYMRGLPTAGSPKAGINWENVNKRILPQLIYKGHVLRREKLCRKGMIFICPTPVFEKIMIRLGGNLYDYEMQPGSITFKCYDPEPVGESGRIRALAAGRQFTTAVEQLANAFTAQSNLPPAGVYQSAIQAELDRI